MKRRILIAMLGVATLSAGLVVLTSAAANGKPLTIDWVDVEGGAATLMVTPAGESVLMDCGWPGERDATRIAKTARGAGLTQIDHYITSHWHTDHFGGIADLVKQIPVKYFYDHSFPELPKPDIAPALVDNYKRATGGKTTTLRPGDEIKLTQTSGSPPLSLRIVAAHGIVVGEEPGAPEIRPCVANPPHAAKDADPSDNARSIAFVLSFGNWKFFDAGDLTWNVEHKLVCPKNLIGTVDVYQVTHHGSDQSNNPATVRALKPRVAIMNNGAKKGGAAATVRTLQSTKSIQGFFAVHRNMQTSPDDNASPMMTANDEEKCSGGGIKLVVAPDAKSYTVTVPSKGTARTFITK